MVFGKLHYPYFPYPKINKKTFSYIQYYKVNDYQNRRDGVGV
jgi:hypothetical protein